MSSDRFREELAEAAAAGTASAACAAHLESCAACRTELDALRRALALADRTLGEIAVAEPSPELRARIRRAAATLAEPRHWRWAWMATAAALLAAVGVTGPWWAGRGARARLQPLTALASPSPSSTASPATLSGPPMGPAESSPTRVPRADPRSAGSGAQRRPSASTRRPDEPEVLVPSGEQEALLRYVAVVQERRASSAALLAVGQSSRDLPGPAEIEIEPLEIVPLDPAEAQGT